MAYKTNNSFKQERKQGMAAMRKMVAAPGFDPQAVLAVARQNLDAFGKLDDLDNATFIRCMDDMRQNHPDLYPVFWWWRDAEEKAGRRQETDSDQPETRYRTFMITQFLAAPFSADWEDDRKNVKPGVAPWITEQQIADGLNHRSIKRWAWVWHDRDVYTEADEIADRNNQVKAGELKFKHAHVVIDIPAKVPISTVARWFNVPPQQVTVPHGRGAFLDCVEYLSHESPRAIDQHKTHYDDDEIHASEGFDFRKELTDLQAHRAKYGKRAGDMTPADTMRMHVMHDGWTMKMCRDDDPLTYGKIRSTLPPLRLDYLMDVPPCPFRLVIYVDGPGGIGKTSFCRYIAQAFFPDEDSPSFEIGNDERVTFDGYDGQPVLIFNDVRVVTLIKQFGREGVFRLLDPHPGKEAQQAKHSRVILCNKITILNGVQPYAEFISGLAGNYTDRFGVQHEAEDENQAWRRVPLILCVKMDDFTVLVNKGFVDDDLDSIKTLYQYAHVRGRMKYMMEKLSGAARETALVTFGEPVKAAAKMIEDSHANQISDPARIPPELMPRVEYQAASMAQAEHDAQARKDVDEYDALLEEAGQYETNCTDALIKFACWFWSSTLGGFAGYIEKHPAEWESGHADIDLFRDDAELERAIRDCLPYFKGHAWFRKPGASHASDFTGSDLAGKFRMDDILQTVKRAWWGGFGEVPSIVDDPGYPQWEARVFWKPENGHRLCLDCHKSVPYDAKFCPYCGQPSLSKIVFGDFRFDQVRFWLADERNCDIDDIPEDDVKLRRANATPGDFDY